MHFHKQHNLLSLPMVLRPQAALNAELSFWCCASLVSFNCYILLHVYIEYLMQYCFLIKLFTPKVSAAAALEAAAQTVDKPSGAGAPKAPLCKGSCQNRLFGTDFD